MSCDSYNGMKYVCKFGTTSQVQGDCDLSKPLTLQNVFRRKKTRRLPISSVSQPVRAEMFQALDAETGKRLACIRLIGNFGSMGTHIDTVIVHTIPFQEASSNKVSFPPRKVRKQE